MRYTNKQTLICMRKASIICAFIACLGMMSFCTKGDIDTTIHQFVEKYFPQTQILTKVLDEGEYDVMLSDNTKLEFTRKGEWKEIDCKHSNLFTAVPAEIVPQAITTYVSTNYPQNDIVKIKKDRRHWEIELDNDLDIEFDKNFNVVEIDM